MFLSKYLDAVPQLKPDWANHIIYGLPAGIPVFAAAEWLGVNYAMELATAFVFALTALKKTQDYLRVGPPTESLKVCVGKTLVTPVWWYTFLVMQHFA